MSTVREKFATQVDAELLESVRSLAKAEGRQIQAVVEDAYESTWARGKILRAAVESM